MNKPRLLIAVDSYLPRWDGIARCLSELLPHMTSQYEIRVIVPNYPGHRPPIEGVTFVPLPLIPLLHSGDLRFPMVFPWSIRAQIQWADILWTHTAVSIGGACIRAAKKKNIPIVSMVHSIEWVVYAKASLLSERLTHWFWLRTARKRYGCANLLLTPGETTKDELLKNKFNKEIQVTPLGVSLQQFQTLPEDKLFEHRRALGLPTDKPIIGYVGRFGPEKDLRTLIAAHALIAKDTDAHLLLVGGTPSELPEMDGQENITVVSPTMNPHHYYQAMDIYVLTSLTESFALGILEAMACGIAPVTTPAGAIPSFIKSGENGVIFPMENPSALAVALKELIANQTKRKELAKNARLTVAEGYTWEKAASRIAEHLNSVLNNPRT